MIEKSYPKINIFLKIEGFKNGYHQLNSRFMKIKNIYDEIEIKKGKFNIIGNFDCSIKDNTIFKAYQKLVTYYPQLKDYFIDKQIIVKKNIPTMAGLGGGSSNAATFLKMVNKDSNLNLPTEKLAKIGAEIGSDVPFFIYDVDVANVYGKGEIIKPYNEKKVDVELIIPPIKCSTPTVFKVYKEKFFNPQKSNFDTIPTFELLTNYSAEELNDLLKPALSVCNTLYKYKEGFFSGSGSSFFKLKT